AGGWVGGTLWRGIGHDSLTAVVQETHPGACSGTGYHFRTIYFSDAQHGWAAGDCGLALATQDGGTSWQPMGVDDRANWSMLRFASKNEAVLAGYDWQGGIRVAHSSDGGKTWSPASASRSSTERLIVASLDVVDPWFGWALVRPRPLDSTFLLLTNDGGQAWAQREVLGGAGSQVQFVDRLRGWIVGSAGLVARSDDGGQTWQIQSLPFSRNVQALSFVDREHGWVLTGDLFMAGTCEECEDEQKCLALFRTSSGGDTWEGPICIQLPGVPARSALVATEIALQLVDENRGWLVAAKGTIMKTSDGGSTWQPQASGTAVDLRDVHFLDAQTGWVTGKDGVLLATTDGGASWKQQRLGTKDLLAVHFVDKQTGWVTAKGPSGFQTTDGGRTWTSVDLPDWTELPSLDAIDGSHVWVGTSLGIRAYAPVCLP
ncbi:MAG: hypothetical protein FJ026_08010, partial [Chloroflexi bacterium]|nr:hypothetical protein [Chloroflexota bacterium]